MGPSYTKITSPSHFRSPKPKASNFTPSELFKKKVQQDIDSIIHTSAEHAAIEPKVLIPYQSNDASSPPRRIEVFRRRTLYQSEDIEVSPLKLHFNICAKLYDTTYFCLHTQIFLFFLYFFAIEIIIRKRH